MNNIIMMTTLSFTMTNHPMSMGLILLIQTIVISTLTGMMSLNFWYSYILFMIMVGGMLVLFIYMTSVASNKKFKLSMKMTIMLTLMLMVIVVTSMMNKKFNMMMLNIDMNTLNSMKNYKMSMNKFMTNPMMLLFMFMIMYLLITLIAVVKITKIKYGPLRIKM
uniref:NADH-ubiquinone oxidoreductase chain 6 n=1 Tax=Stenocladius sp. FM17 TaxID=2596692 RepID=A0A5C0PWI7_9COLE|nr:NADH dehydrogenase subunit 6 [Stenocladius sp. FM17]